MSIKVSLSLRALNQVMTSDGVQKVVDDAAARIAERAGDGVEVAPKPHKWVGRTFVQTVTDDAARAEATDKTLTRAVGS